jgi:hypothetical protein
METKTPLIQMFTAQPLYFNVTTYYPEMLNILLEPLSQQFERVWVIEASNQNNVFSLRTNKETTIKKKRLTVEVILLQSWNIISSRAYF